MKLKKILLFFISITLFCCNKKETYTVSPDFNFDWQFRLIDSVSKEHDWKKIRLPHDWSVEASFDSITGEGATGYLPGGIGEYKKEFPLKLADDQMAYVVFDGVYNNATVSLNGQELGFHPYGYSPFYFDISSKLKSDNTLNALTVNVDRTRYVDSRWYSGSGIYRNVELHVKNKLHIPIWGTFVTTPKVSDNLSEVSVEVKVTNAYEKEKTIEVYTEIFDGNGVSVGQQPSEMVINSNDTSTVTQFLSVENTKVWDVDNPYIYKAVTSVVQNGKILDTQETPFGIRTFRFDANEGFFLNGKNRKIKGVCLHHDAGLVGAAVPKGVWKRRLNKLKEAGCNAIRISHNPGSQEFLDLCDEMGFLVQDEFL
nr:hypothetical protein [Zobellia laminariae]